jgi:hypothetical protein
MSGGGDGRSVGPPVSGPPLVIPLLVAATAAVILSRAAFGGSASANSPSSAPAQPREYRDSSGRFSFSYPPAFGVPSVGTDDGFANRVAALRFSVFSSQGIGGEAVLGKGRPSLDVLAAGGLYDDIASGTLPGAIKSAVEKVLPALTRANFCEQIGRGQHIEVSAAVFAFMTAPQRAALADLDRLGNYSARIDRCTSVDDVIVFDKEASVVAGGPRRRTYGAVRFLTGPYSTFQLIRAGGSADASVIDDMRAVVASFRPQ